MWESEEKKVIESKAEMIDVLYTIECTTLPYDHAFDLSNEITKKLPWLIKNDLNGIQTLHGPESGNGWTRAENETIFLSKRTKLILRISKDQIENAKELENIKINIAGNILKIKNLTLKPFSISRVLFCRCVLSDENIGENEFLDNTFNQLKNYNITIKKSLCGKSRSITLDGKNNFTRSLMLAGLSREDSIKLQDIGIGRGRIFGCGIFLPHKSIDAVDNFKEE